jgi:hypothetical protein
MSSLEECASLEEDGLQEEELQRGALEGHGSQREEGQEEESEKGGTEGEGPLVEMVVLEHQ